MQCYVDELLVIRLKLAEARIRELELELEASRSRSPKSSKLVQVELAAPKPANCSLGVQAEIASPKASTWSRAVQCLLLDSDTKKVELLEKRDAEKKESVSVKVQTVTLEDRGIETEQLIEHQVETFVFTARNLPLLVGDEDDDVEGASCLPKLPPEATADVAALCTRAGEELGLHRRLLRERLEERARERRQREECEDRGVQAVVASETRGALTDPEVKPKLVDVRQNIGYVRVFVFAVCTDKI